MIENWILKHSRLQFSGCGPQWLNAEFKISIDHSDGLLNREGDSGYDATKVMSGATNGRFHKVVMQADATFAAAVASVCQPTDW